MEKATFLRTRAARPSGKRSPEAGRLATEVALGPCKSLMRMREPQFFLGNVVYLGGSPDRRGICWLEAGGGGRAQTWGGGSARGPPCRPPPRGGERSLREAVAVAPVSELFAPRAAAMAYCRQEGKDRIIFVTKEDHETPSSAELVADDPNDPYEEHGLILPNGDINWNCPCLGGMASGPCGEQFKSAFSCFHYSTEDIKGSDCVDQFRAMQECMQKYPDLYPQEEEEEEEKKPEPEQDTAATEPPENKEKLESS